MHWTHTISLRLLSLKKLYTYCPITYIDLSQKHVSLAKGLGFVSHLKLLLKVWAYGFLTSVD